MEILFNKIWNSDLISMHMIQYRPLSKNSKTDEG